MEKLTYEKVLALFAATDRKLQTAAERAEKETVVLWLWVAKTSKTAKIVKLWKP